MDYQTEDQGSSGKAWYIVGIIVIIALALWYYYGKQMPFAGTESPMGQMEVSSDADANTTMDISSDLDQIPDISADLDQDAAAAAQAVQGL